MKDVRSTVMQLSGRWGNEYYRILCLAVETARSLPPDDFQMKRVWSEVQRQSGKSTAAVSRALSRAAADIWQRGSREKLSEIFGKTLPSPPTAKELICALTEYLRPRTEYRLWSSPSDGSFGLTASDDYGRRVITAPFTKDRAFVQTLAASLNAAQCPRTEYRLWSSPSDGAFGLTASDDYGRRVITAPFTKDRAFVQTLAASLNAAQCPLDTFRTQFLAGEIPGVLPESGEDHF